MKKIMFNDRYGLTQAVLDGRKTQTRRKFTLTLHIKANGGNGLIEVSPTMVYFEEGEWKFVYDDYAFLLPKINHPKYKIGEVVAVAQNYKDAGIEYVTDKDGFLYHTFTIAGWDNKMFVQAALMPNSIRITNVRIQRLQDISDEDCIKEGINEATRDFPWYWYECNGKKVTFNEQIAAFSSLIDKVSGKGTWESNPYVWVYDFELVKP